MYFVAYLALLISLTVVAFNIYKIGNTQHKTAARRLQQLGQRNAPKNQELIQAKSRTGLTAEYFQKIIALFNKIGIEISIREILILNSISSLSLFLIIFLLNKNIAVSLLLGSLGFFLPYLVVNSMVAQRNKAFDKLFGDALTLISNTLRAGFSLRQALQLVAEEMPMPICDEFKLLNQEIDWGLPLSDCFNELCRRIPNEHVQLFATAILIQNEVGGSLAEIVSKIAETIRNKEQLKGELNVLTSQGKISGLIVGLMPLALGMFIFAINPTYMLVLFTTPLGLMMLGIAVVMELFGAVVIKSIIKL